MDKPTPPPATSPQQPEKSQAWSLDPLRRNRFRVRLLLAVQRMSTPRSRLTRRLRRTMRDWLGFQLSSDFRSSSFGPGLFLPHPYGIVVHARVRLGRDVTLYQNVTIGEDNRRPGVPVLGDDVVVGAGAVILGPVTVGNRACVGANAVVVDDVQPNTTVGGIPARTLSPRPKLTTD